MNADFESGFAADPEAVAANVALAIGTGVAGLFSVGRNGEFLHIFMEDVYLRTVRHADRLLKYLTGPRETV